MSEMHLGQPGFTYSVCGPITKNKERIQKFSETGDSRYIYQNKLDKACFQHDMAYGDFKDLTRRTASDKILHDKAFKDSGHVRSRINKNSHNCLKKIFLFFCLILSKTCCILYEKSLLLKNN